MFKVPYLTTSIPADIAFCVLLIPVFWCLGVEQFIWPGIALYLFIKWVISYELIIKKDKMYAFVLIYLSFILLSGLMIDENYRYVTYVRNASLTFASAFCSFLVFQTCRKQRDVDHLIFSLVFFQVCLAISGGLAIIGVSFEYRAPLANLFSSFSQQGYLSDIFNKSFIQAEALWFRQGFIRPKGMMLYPNILAGVVASLSAIKYFVVRTYEMPWLLKKFLFISFMLDVAVIVATLSRSTWLAITLALFLLFMLGNLNIRKKLGFIAAVAVAAGALYSTGGIEIMSYRTIEKGHSNDERWLNYQITFDKVTQNPLRLMFGYGTQRDAPELNVPVGSHSTYLGVLFKYGMLGMLIFLLILVNLYLRLRKYISLERHVVSASSHLLARCLLVAITIILVQALFIEIDVDAVYQFLFWILLGISMTSFPYSGIPLIDRVNSDNV